MLYSGLVNYYQSLYEDAIEYIDLAILGIEHVYDIILNNYNCICMSYPQDHGLLSKILCN